MKIHVFLLVGGMLMTSLFSASVSHPASSEPVRFEQTRHVIPTYKFGRSETVAPLFKSIENMGHYPYTAVDWDSRATKPVPVEYESLRLENEYLRIEVLPEFGGRIFSAYDKTAKREIFYHTTVIKPSRYNQRGGWPVGNLELYGPFDAHMLTWPGEPWAWALDRQPDGSASIVLSHIDHFFRDKISLIITLRPGHAYVETTVRLRNRNLLPNRYMLWTNAGVAATEGSRFVYPMTKTIGHDNSALDTWPVINGVDMSWNRNNKSMLGVFGLDIFDNFMSIYDYSSDYGTICYTNRLLARGMKTWTFGSGQTALRHMAVYTDNDGLYMETQSGRFIWDGNYEFIDPGKTDGWTEYWFGAGGLGGLTTATRDVAVLFETPKERPGEAKLAVTATASFAQASLEVLAGGKPVWTAKADLAVGTAYRAAVPLPAASLGQELELRIRSAEADDLMDYRVYPDGSHPDPSYAGDSVPRKWGPVDRLQVEELYQKGLGHEKFGQIPDAQEAYRAALVKDPQFSPVLLRLGLLALDKFDCQAAVPYFEKALERDPTNGDAHYFLGLIHTAFGHRVEAERHFFRILPSSSKFDLRDYCLALLALRESDLRRAAPLMARSAANTPSDLSIRQGNAYLLRKTGMPAEADAERQAILKLDSTNAFARAEQAFASENPEAALQLMDGACAGHSQGYIELVTDYMRLNAWEEASRVAQRAIGKSPASSRNAYPLLYYYAAYAEEKLGKSREAAALRSTARRQDLQLEIYPFRFEDVDVLNSAVKADSADANAMVLLGDLLYSQERRDEAVALWRRAVAAEPKNFSALRDLGMALLVNGSREDGLKMLNRASELRPEHLGTTVVIANVNAAMGNPEAARSAFRRSLDRNPGSDALYERLAVLEAQTGNPGRALELMTGRTFNPTHQSYSLLHLYRAVRLTLALQAFDGGKNLRAALDHVHAAAQPPASLGVDDFASVKSSRLLTFEALLAQAAGDKNAAKTAWEAAAATSDDDVETEGIFRAIALQKTGRAQEATAFFHEYDLVNPLRIADGNPALRVHAIYIAGIHAAFRGDDAGAARDFRRALEVDPSFLYARQALAWLDAGLLKGLQTQ
jgi:tetratricopeptide (TPR) repeat protein